MHGEGRSIEWPELRFPPINLWVMPALADGTERAGVRRVRRAACQELALRVALRASLMAMAARQH